MNKYSSLHSNLSKNGKHIHAFIIPRSASETCTANINCLEDSKEQNLVDQERKPCKLIRVTKCHVNTTAKIIVKVGISTTDDGQQRPCDDMLALHSITAPPAFNKIPRLLFNLQDIIFETQHTQSIHHALELYLALHLCSVVRHIRSNHRLHNYVHLLLCQHVIPQLEEWFVGFWAYHKGESFVENVQCEYKSVFLVASFHHFHWRCAKFDAAP